METGNGRRVAAFVASTVLHVAAIASLLAPTTRARLETSPTHRDRPLTASLFFLQEPHAVHVDSYVAASTMTLQTITLPVPELPEIDAIAADSFERADSITSAEDLAAVERLQGIYVKQIADRITRLLQMAKETGGAVSNHRCIVHVIQNEAGDVLDVDMEECEREPGARDRLASAIRAASPLPPPPDGLAMGSYLTIDASAL
jgi:hypothetical protein